MRIRTKLLLAMLVPLALLIAQIATISLYIKDLQSAVNFISSAHSLIEADFKAADLVETLRREIKRLPSRYVTAQAALDENTDPMTLPWQELEILVAEIQSSNAIEEVPSDLLQAVTRSFNAAYLKYRETTVIASGNVVDLDTLFEQAIFIDKDLISLKHALDSLAVELREKLKSAVDREREIHNLPIQAGIVIGIIAILLLLGFGLLAATHTLRPVRDLMQGATRVAQGDLKQKVPVRSRDEVGILAQTFNDMATQLQQSFDKLEAQNEELQRLDKLKDEFLANTSHELRTPLNGIIGLAESIRDGATGPLQPATEKNLSMIVGSGKRLASLVNDILDFSKLKNQAFELQTRPLDIHTLSEVVVTLSQSLIGSKPITLVNRLSADVPLVMADENRIQQILLNLVGNAIKFTDAGEVRISAEPRGDQLAITVSDTGIGIPPGKSEFIFESFQQGDGSVARQYGGTGLGLAVSKQLVELHGGQIEVSSVEHEGSHFTFTLPLADPGTVNVPDQPVARLRTQAEEAGQAVELAAIAETGSGEGEAAPAASGERHSILIVDDEPINLQVLTNHLSAQDYKITQAQSGYEALELFARDMRFDLVLLDVMMPRISGFEVCQKLREKFPPHALPVIMLTAKNQVSDLVAGFDSGANDYLTKPFSKEELMTRLGSQLQLTKTTKSFGRFVPLEYLEFLDRDSIVNVHLGDYISKEMTVMFSDLRAFTTISESMTPQENFDFINAYLGLTSPAIREHNGFIIKYLGDGMMAVFPESPDDAVRAGVEKLKRVEEYNKAQQYNGHDPVKIGIGVNTGHMMVGIVGEPDRMQGDAFSDHVNLTSRVEGLTKFYSVSFIITAATYSRLNSPDDYCIRFLDKVRVKGKTEALDLYEVFDADSVAQRDLKQATRQEYLEALDRYYEQDFLGAQALLFSVLKQNPKDKVAWHHLVQATNALENGIPDNWIGVTRMEVK